MSVHRRAALISLVLIAAALPNSVAAQAPESLAGTWKLNATTSKYDRRSTRTRGAPRSIG